MSDTLLDTAHSSTLNAHGLSSNAAQRGRPWGLVVAAWAVALTALAPIGFLLLESWRAGWAAITAVLFRHLTVSLLVNTIEMTVLVTAIAAVLGVGAAWLLERTDLPFRRFFFVALLIPAAIPDFIETFGWVGVWPALRGLWGAVFVLSLAVYPFVMLPVVAGLRRIDQGREEVARSLGSSTLRTFVRVTLPELAVPIAGGCLVVALQLLAEYGSFQILGFRTFTTEIFAAFQVGFDAAAAAALSLVLVLLSAVLVRLEGSAGEGGRSLLTSEGIAPRRLALGRLRPFATLLAIQIDLRASAQQLEILIRSTNSRSFARLLDRGRRPGIRSRGAANRGAGASLFSAAPASSPLWCALTLLAPSRPKRRHSPLPHWIRRWWERSMCASHWPPPTRTRAMR